MERNEAAVLSAQPADLFRLWGFLAFLADLRALDFGAFISHGHE